MDEYVHLIEKPGSRCWALKGTAIDRKKIFSSEIAKAIIEKFYIGDYLASFDV